MARPQKSLKPVRGRANIAVSAIPTRPLAEARMPNIAYMRQEVSRMMPKWQLVKDCLGGQESIKQAGVTYLPMPKVDDILEQQARYSAYVERAVWYNATRRTLDGLMGEVFSRDPIRVLPTGLQTLQNDADGEGVSLDQAAKLALSYTMSYGRGGFFVDYPDVLGPVTVAQQASGEIRPTISPVAPMNIVNWRTKQRGAKRILDLVVIMDKYVMGDDGFEVAYDEQYRVLSLVNDVYCHQLWRKRYNDVGVLMGYYVYSSSYPTDGAGKNFDVIPFQFYGSIDNNEYPDNPPLYDLAVLNIGHYRNSADYEEACFIVGQPTAWFSGLTKDWVDDVFKGGRVYLGSRAIVPLPAGAQAGLLQVTANSMPKEAMDQKESQMAALGAKLVDKSGAQRTLGEAQMDETSGSSILSAAAKNVSLAMVRALQFAHQFNTGEAYADATVVSYDLNTDFPSSRLTPNERAQLMLEWQGGGITWAEYRAGLHKAGIAFEDDDKAKTEGEQMQQDKMDQAIKTAQATAATKPASSSGSAGSPNSGGTNKPKLNQGNGGGNQAGS